MWLEKLPYFWIFISGSMALLTMAAKMKRRTLLFDLVAMVCIVSLVYILLH